MDPNTSIGRLCLGENNQGSVAEGIENKEHWEGPEFQDTASSGQEKEVKVFTFYRTEEEGERENRENLVKRELLVSLKGEFYFVKFIVNPEEDDVEPSEKVAREALAIDICKRFSILEEERPVIETMAYSDKYKKILDGIVMDKIKLDGEIKKEEEEVIKQVKGEALKEKEDPGAFIIPIRLEAKIDLNALADTGSDINGIPYRIYAKLEPLEVLKDVLCQVGVTTIIVKLIILDMPIDRDAPILVGRGLLYKPFKGKTFGSSEGCSVPSRSNGYSLKDKNEAKTDKTEHGNGKSMKSRSQRRVHLKWANPYPS
ncbi:hypothetical protein Tco_1013107 [Tanacetum coccineum]